MAAGDVTISNPGSVGANTSFASGYVAADADTAINVSIGFVPSKITLYYKDTGATTQDKIITWFKGMTAGYYWSLLMSTGVVTLATSGGPTVYGDTSDDLYGLSSSSAYPDDGEDTSGAGAGFTIPAGLMDADSDTIYFVADR